MSFDFDGTLRWLKPQRKRAPLARRTDSEFAWIGDAPLVGGPVVLDTTVYIDVLSGRSPSILDEFIGFRVCNHCSVCVAELTHAFGRLAPSDPRTGPALKKIGQAIRNIPAYRISVPDEATWAAAGILSGMLFRLGCFQAGAERKCLNDALVYLQARKLGCAVLSGNIRDFDYLNQLVPDGRVLMYRRAA